MNIFLTIVFLRATILLLYDNCIDGRSTAPGPLWG